MRIWNGDPYVLQVARVVHKVPPRRCFATFIVKATFNLINDHPAWPVSEPDARQPLPVRIQLGPTDPALRPALPGADVPEAPPASLTALPNGLNLVENDFAPFKPRGDFIVVADAHAPGGQPVTALETAVRIGDRVKRLLVAGDHEWVEGGLTPLRPFTSMPLSYTRAFGGPGWPLNPVGKGKEVQLDRRGRRFAEMPNIVYPDRAVGSPDAQEEPAGFGPLPAFWPQRTAGKFGTYDDDWRRNRWPWFPSDFDWSHYNCAPADQQLEGYFRGDEELAFKNLHPEHPLFRSRLPGLRARLFYKEYVEGVPEVASTSPAAPAAHPHAEPPAAKPPARAPVASSHEPGSGEAVAEALNATFDIDHLFAPMPSGSPRVDVFADLGPYRWREVNLNLDTVVADLKAGRLTLVWRGLQETRSLRMREVGDLYVTHEPVDAPAADRKVHLVRLESLKSQLRDVMNEGLGDPEAVADEIERRVAALAPAIETIQTVAAEQAKATAARHPQPPASSGPAPTPPPQQPLPPAAKAELDKAVTAAAAKLPPEQAVAFRADVDHVTAGRPAQELPSVKAAEAAGYALRDEIEAKIAGVEAELNEKLGPMVGGKVSGESFADRDAFIQAVREGRDMRACRGYALDLRNLDLTGIDLRNAMLPKANLTGSILRDAKLAHANLYGATLRRVDFAGADLSHASFPRAIFGANRFAGCILSMTNLSRAVLAGMDFSGCHGELAVFLDADLSGCRFGGARLPKAALVGATLAGSDFADADLSEALLMNVKAADAQFTRATLDRVNAGTGADFTGASFLHARANGINLEKALLREADFGGAALRGAFLNEADAAGALFEHADLTDASLEDMKLAGARMVNANLLRASLARADLTRADLRGSNMYRALLADTLLDKTAVGGAFVKGTLLQDEPVEAGGEY